MTARDLSALSDDALMGALHAGAPESVLLEGADILTRHDPVPAGVSAAAHGVAPAFPGHLRLRRELGEIEIIASFTVEGEPVSKSRARFTKQGSKTQAYTPEKTYQAEQAMAWHFKAAARSHKLNPEATYGVGALFRSATRQRRDVDNMTKLILDSLNGVAWVDDNQVVEISARKELAELKSGTSAQTDVVVYRIGALQRNLATCEQCGVEYTTFQSWEARRFCTAACHYEWRRTRRERACEYCGKTFEGAKLEAPPKFCSRQCADDAKRAVVNCSGCGVEFTKQRCHVRAKNFCSARCRDASYASMRAKYSRGTCSTCGGFTSKKTYIQCQTCRWGAVDASGKPRPIPASAQTDPLADDSSQYVTDGGVRLGARARFLSFSFEIRELP